MRKRKHSIAKSILLGVPAALLLAFAFLQSPPGKALLADWISKALGASGSIEVRVGNISGLIPARIKLDSLALGDRDGIWLVAKDLEWRWTLKDLLDSVVNVERLAAGSIDIQRLPKGGEPPAGPKQKRGFRPIELVLGHLEIGSLRLGEAVAGIPLEYAVHSGGMRLHATGALSGSIEVSGDASGRMVFTAPPLGTGDYLLKVCAELKTLHKPDIGLPGLVGTAEATISPDGTRLVLQASAEDIALALDAHVVAASGTWNLEFGQLTLEYQDTISIEGRGSIGSERMDLKGELAVAALNRLPIGPTSNFTGRVAGRVALAGTLAAPHATASVDVLDLTTTQVSLGELPDINLHFDVELAEGLLHAVSRITNSVSGSMAASIDLPCIFSLQPVCFQPAMDRLALSFKAGADLGLLNELSLFTNERVEGELDAELVYNGQAGQKLTGHIVIADGMYEHYGWGLVVRDIQAKLEAVADGLVIEHMTASDGGDGRVEVSGSAHIWKPGIPIGLNINIEKANLIRRDAVDGMLSGALQIGGMLAHPSVQGQIIVDRAEILLDHMAQPEPRLLTSFNIHDTTNTATAATAKKVLPFTMNIDVSMPDKVFVNAAMIDSAWGGQLTLKDASGGVSVAGVLRPRRGYLSFIGKKFRLMDDGRIDLDGTVPPSASINIRAEYSRSDIVAQLGLTGKLNDPKYTLTSTPDLPEDEILSHVLFGHDISSISPYQAFQIAAAARQLSSGGSGAGFIYQARQALGIDTLEWREPEFDNGTSSVSAGKYLANGLYVEVDRTLEREEGGTSVMAEYELTRHISVETSTGPQMRPGIGVSWRNDY